MALVELVMPKMGESIMEATILKWVKNVGDKVEADETILEIATDKVDSEVPSPVSGTIQEIRFKEDETVEVGKVIAIIAPEGEESSTEPTPSKDKATANGSQAGNGQSAKGEKPAPPIPEPVMETSGGSLEKTGPGGRFYSPLVRNIAEKENVSMTEL